MPDLAIVGAGVMGANHVRTAHFLREWEHVVVVDPDLERARSVASTTGFQVNDDLDSVLGEVDAVIVAAPSDLHEAIAGKVLRAGLHTLVEKPLAPDLASARRLAEVADGTSAKVLVGHVERFNSAVVEVMNWADKAVHVEFRRVGPKGKRVLGDVVSDLMVHDLEIFLSLARAHAIAHQLDPSLAEVVEVQAMWADAGDDLCFASVRTGSGLTASFTASRIGQAKMRSIIVTGREVQIAANLVHQSVSIDRIEHVEFVDERGARYRQTGTNEIPFLDSGEPLVREQRHFAAVVAGQREPLVGIPEALRALALVEAVRRAADESSGRSLGLS